jgi:hypothetical protein
MGVMLEVIANSSELTVHISFIFKFDECISSWLLCYLVNDHVYLEQQFIYC